MDVLLDLLDVSLDTGDFVAVECLKRLRPDLMDIAYVRTKTELTMSIVTRVLRWCITYQYRADAQGQYFVATAPTWHFQPTFSMYSIRVYPVACNFVYKSDFVLRGFVWKESQRLATGIVYRRAQAAQHAPSLYYEAAVGECGCHGHHAIDTVCGQCPRDACDDDLYISVRRFTRCHHLAVHDVQQLHCPFYDEVVDLNLIADRPHKTIKYTGPGRLENPLLLPCIAMVTLTSTFPYYKRIPCQGL